MSRDVAGAPLRFEPLRPASRAPLLWLAALALGALVLEYSWAIALGLAVAFASFVLALIVLLVLHAARGREERRYVDGR